MFIEFPSLFHKLQGNLQKILLLLCDGTTEKLHVISGKLRTILVKNDQLTSEKANLLNLLVHPLQPVLTSALLATNCLVCINMLAPVGLSVSSDCVTLHLLCSLLLSALLKFQIQRRTPSKGHLRSINTLHLYFIYFTRGKSRRAFLFANGSHTMRLTGHQSCVESPLK